MSSMASDNASDRARALVLSVAEAQNRIKDKPEKGETATNTALLQGLACLQEFWHTGYLSPTHGLATTCVKGLSESARQGLTRKEKVMEWYVKVLQNYAGFEGRCTAYGVLDVCLVQCADLVRIGTRGWADWPRDSVLGSLYSLAVLVPSIAVAVRRLHDIGKSGWWILIGLIVCPAAFVLLYFYVQDSQPESNQYGPNPNAI